MIITLFEEMVFTETSPQKRLPMDLYNRILLALGSIANKLSLSGQEKRSLQIVNVIHSRLGMHGMCWYSVHI